MREKNIISINFLAYNNSSINARIFRNIWWKLSDWSEYLERQILRESRCIYLTDMNLINNEENDLFLIGNK